MTFDHADELPHPGAAIDEWVFAAWVPDASMGCISGHRLIDGRAWYWSAVVQRAQPLLELTEWAVGLRGDPFIVKAPEMWAEHHCDDPMSQWSIGNEGYFVALDDPDDALGRAYGTPTPVSFDLEWYATAEPTALGRTGYEQAGVVHGRIELAGGQLDLTEVPAHRWRRWSEAPSLKPLPLVPLDIPQSGERLLRAPFRFPDGSVSEWTLTKAGWVSPPGTQT